MKLAVDPVEKIQQTINHFVQQDAQTLNAIQALAGKIITIEISGPEYRINLQFHDQGITLMQEFNGKPHVTIRARPVTFLALLKNRNNGTTTSPDMDISGDVALAQDFQKILHSIEIDWEEELSHWIGDTAAHKLGRLVKHTRKFIQETKKTIALDVSEYLRYEKDMLPDREEVEEFITAVDDLRNDTERMQQRIERLLKKTNSSHRYG